MANTFKNAGIQVGTSRTTLYTCPAATTAVIHALYISNVDGAVGADVDIEITIDGGTTYRYVGKTLAVPEDSTLVLDKPINLEAGDILAVTSSSAGDIEAVCAILEIA
jgi:hypothetical protein